MFGSFKTYSSSGFLWGPIDIWEEKVVFPQLCMKIVWTTCRFHSLYLVYFAPWWCLRNLPITQCGDIFIFKYLVCQVFCFTDLPVYSFYHHEWSLVLDLLQCRQKEWKCLRMKALSTYLVALDVIKVVYCTIFLLRTSEFHISFTTPPSIIRFLFTYTFCWMK